MMNSTGTNNGASLIINHTTPCGSLEVLYGVLVHLIQRSIEVQSRQSPQQNCTLASRSVYLIIDRNAAIIEYILDCMQGRDLYDKEGSTAHITAAYQEFDCYLCEKKNENTLGHWVLTLSIMAPEESLLVYLARLGQ